MNLKTRSKIVIVSTLMLALLGCTTATVITDIEFAVNVVSAAAPIIAPFAGPGATVVAAYVVAAANGLDCALTAGETPGATTATTAAAILTCLGKIVIPVLPAGTPSVIAGIVTAIGNQIASLLQKYGTQSVGVMALAPMPVKLGFKDHRAIHAMHKKLKTAEATIAASHK